MSGSFADRNRNVPGRLRDVLAVPPPTPTPTPTPEPEAEAEHPAKCFGYLRGIRERADNVEFRFLDVNRNSEALDCSWQPRVSWRKRPCAIVLCYPSLGITVTIHGINLWELKELLRRRRVTWVHEQGTDPIRLKELEILARQAGEEPVIVTRIEFDEPPQARHGGQGELEEA